MNFFTNAIPKYKGTEISYFRHRQRTYQIINIWCAHNRDHVIRMCSGTGASFVIDIVTWQLKSSFFCFAHLDLVSDIFEAFVFHLMLISKIEYQYCKSAILLFVLKHVSYGPFLNVFNTHTCLKYLHTVSTYYGYS